MHRHVDAMLGLGIVFVLILLNAALFAAGLVNKEQLSDNWFIVDAKRTWLLYEVPALVLPLSLDRVLGRAGRRFPGYPRGGEA